MSNELKWSEELRERILVLEFLFLARFRTFECCGKKETPPIDFWTNQHANLIDHLNFAGVQGESGLRGPPGADGNDGEVGAQGPPGLPVCQKELRDKSEY